MSNLPEVVALVAYLAFYAILALLSFSALRYCPATSRWIYRAMGWVFVGLATASELGAAWVLVAG